VHDPAKIQQFFEQAKSRGLLISEAPPRTAAERMVWQPPFVFVISGVRLATQPNVKAVNELTKFAKSSGLWPCLLGHLLELRIDSASIQPTARVERYEWTERAASEGTVSFGEWTASRKYRRRESSSTLEAVSAA